MARRAKICNEDCFHCPYSDCIRDGTGTRGEKISSDERKKKRAEYHRERYRANRERILAQVHAYYRKNREKIAAKQRERYRANREQILARQNAYYRANREEILARKRKRRAQHGET